MYLFRTPLLQALIGFFELPEDDSIPDDEHFIDIEDTPGYQTAFSQLAFAGKKEHDPIGDAVGNPKILLAQSLHKLSTACPGRVSSQMQAVLFFFWFDSMCLESKNCHFGNHIDKHCTFFFPLSVQVPSMLSTSLNAEALQFLQGYLQAATVQLV